jgi:competence protein CoiA
VDGGPSFCQYHITNPIICNTFMALYAVNDDDLIHAADAEPGKIYWCTDCFGPVKKRGGRRRFDHFYHLKTSPSCRLYSKTEDHLMAQLQLQKKFPEGTLQLEKPFIKINRVADVCWEKEKIVFEIQCSQLSEKEAEMRIQDYRSIGYETVWLLDDKRYNKRVIRPAEDYLRKRSTYYLSIRRGVSYDQFEVFSEGRRVKRGKEMPVDLQKICRGPKKSFSEELFPKQIAQLDTHQYFHGDRLFRAHQNHRLTMLRWRTLEIQAIQPKKSTSWFRRYIAGPYVNFLERMLRVR